MTGSPTTRRTTMAVVTRTRNCGLLLRRSMESLVGQYNRTFVWVIVNDGGLRTDVESVAVEAGLRGLPVVVVHHDDPRGMEEAANAGLAAVDSEFVAFLNDCDTWDPHFVPETISYLSKNPDRAGVVVKTTRVVEWIDYQDRITTLLKEPYRPELNSVHLSEMAERNLFPQSSFVYRRSVLDTIGLYDPTLRALGDWDFNLRFLQSFDIGVHPGALANHHRWSTDRSSIKDTAVVEPNLREEWDAAIRNRWLRKDLDAGVVGLGHLLAAGRRGTTTDGKLQATSAPRSFARRAYASLRRISGKAA